MFEEKQFVIDSVLFFPRITIPLAFSIGFVATIVPILWSGPVYFATQGSADACQKFGWYNVLYMNIYQDIFQPDTSAGGVSENSIHT
jgi:hypothetical protein